jgi:rhodanese-related sulfurtransferase
VLTLLAVSAGLAFAANLLRSDRLELGTDPGRYRYQDVHFVSVDDAARVRDAPTTLFLDARDGATYERRRIFGAVSLPADGIEAAYADLRDFLAPDMTLIIYSKDLLFSVRVARFLDERGYDTAVLDGGWDAWRDAGLPVE